MTTQATPPQIARPLWFPADRYHTSILVALCVLVYARTMGVPFYFDDFPYVANNPLIRDFGNYFHNIQPPPNIPDDIYNNFRTRPLAYLSFSLNYLIHGISPAGYHLVNIVIHVVNTLLVYLLVTGILVLGLSEHKGSDTPVAETQVGTVAFFTAALFAAHPVMTNAVTYVAQRMTSMAALFYMATAVLYTRHLVGVVKGRSWTPYYPLALFSCCAGMITKETCFTIPIALLLLDLVFHRDTAGRRLFRLLPFAATMAIIPFTVLKLENDAVEQDWNTLGSAIHLVNFTEISPTDYFFTQLRAIAFYLRLLVLPTGLSLEHDFPLSVTFTDPGVPAAFLLHLLFVCCAGHLIFRYRGGPSFIDLLKVTVGFGIAWFYLTLSVSSSFIPITELAVEYRLYLPTAGFMLCVVAALFVLHSRFRPLNASGPGFWIPMVLLVTSIGMTMARNEVWRDPEQFWRQTIHRYPGLGRPYANLADHHLTRGNTGEAIQVYREAIGRLPNLAILHYELGNVYIRTGQYREAVAELNEAIRMAPDKREAYESLARAECYLGHFDEAQRILSRGQAAEDEYFH